MAARDVIRALADIFTGELDSEAKVTGGLGEGRGLGRAKRSEGSQREVEGVG